MTVQTTATTQLAAPRSLLDRFLREAAEAVTEQRKELGRRIAQARKAKGWKQKQLAAAVHVEPTTVSRWETGRHAPDLDVLEEIARATGQPASFFLTDSSAPTRADDADVLERLLAEVSATRREVGELRGIVEELREEQPQETPSTGRAS